SDYHEACERIVRRGAAELNEALRAAAANGHAELVELLLTVGKTPSWMSYAFMGADGAHNAQMMGRDKPFWDRALCAAAEGGHTAVAKLLVEAGAKELDNAFCAAAK